MTFTEILYEIHKRRLELEVCQELQRWLTEDRKMWIDRAMESEAIVRAVHMMATRVQNPKDALTGIANISAEDAD